MGKVSYSDNDKAAALLALESNGGNLKRTSRETGIPLTTIRNWRDGNGVTGDVAEISNESKPDLVTRMLDELNEVLNLLPEKRKDASYNDLVRAAGILTDKVQLLNGGLTARVGITWETIMRGTDDGSATPDDANPFA